MLSARTSKRAAPRPSFRGRRRAVLARSPSPAPTEESARGMCEACRRAARSADGKSTLSTPDENGTHSWVRRCASARPLRPHRSLRLAPPPKLLGEVGRTWSPVRFGWCRTGAGAGAGGRRVPCAAAPGPRGGAGWIPRPCLAPGGCARIAGPGLGMTSHPGAAMAIRICAASLRVSPFPSASPRPLPKFHARAREPDETGRNAKRPLRSRGSKRAF
jgi:hypothetical protein